MALYRNVGFDRLEYHGQSYNRGDIVEMPEVVAARFPGKLEEVPVPTPDAAKDPPATPSAGQGRNGRNRRRR